MNPDLATGQADRLSPLSGNRHGHKRHRLLFAGGQQHVHFASRRRVCDL